MSDAERKVTIVLDLKAGDITPFDLQNLVGADKSYKEITESLKSVGAAQKEVADTESALVNAHKAAQEALDRNTQKIMEEWAAKDRAIEQNKKLAESLKDVTKNIPVQTDFPNMMFSTPDRTQRPGGPNTSNLQVREPEDVAAAKALQKQVEAEEKAAREREKLRQTLRDRILETENEISESTKKSAEEAAEAYKKMGKEADAATARLPQNLRSIQTNLSQTIGQSGIFINHLGMMKSLGSSGLEDVARRFAKIHSTIGLITSSQSVMSNLGESLAAMTARGALLQKQVAMQQQLGVATTFTQAATMRLAGAAQVANAALGPVSLVIAAVTTGLAILEISTDVFGDTAEKAAKRAEEGQKRFASAIENSIDRLDHEKKLIEAQNGILETQFDIQKKLRGDKLIKGSDIMSELTQKTDLNNQGMQTALQKGAQGILGGFSDKDQAESSRLRAEQKRLEDERRNYEQRKRELEIAGDKSYKSVYASINLENNSKRIAENEKEITAFRERTGGNAIERLGNTQVNNGMIVDMQGFMKNLADVPKTLRKESESMVTDIMQKAKDQSKLNIDALDTAERQKKEDEQKIASNKSELERRTKEFGAEEDMAGRFESQEGMFASQEVENLLQQFEKSADANFKQSIADEIEKMLQQKGLLSSENATNLRGSNTDVAAVRSQIAEDRDAGPERKEFLEKKSELEKTSAEAQQNLDTMTAIASDLRRIITTQSRQLTELQRALAQ